MPEAARPRLRLTVPARSERRPSSITTATTAGTAVRVAAPARRWATRAASAGDLDAGGYHQKQGEAAQGSGDEHDPPGEEAVGAVSPQTAEDPGRPPSHTAGQRESQGVGRQGDRGHGAQADVDVAGAEQPLLDEGEHHHRRRLEAQGDEQPGPPDVGERVTSSGEVVAPAGTRDHSHHEHDHHRSSAEPGRADRSGGAALGEPTGVRAQVCGRTRHATSDAAGPRSSSVPARGGQPRPVGDQWPPCSGASSTVTDRP